MILFRYLAKEVGMTLLAVITVLVLIFMSNQVMLYLNRAASGSIPAKLIVQLLLLELPNLISLLLPLGFYFSLLVSYGRLYADSEMVVLQACGYSSSTLLRHTLVMASGVVVIIVTILNFTPQIDKQRTKLLQENGVQTLIQTVVPGRFKTALGNQYVYYVEKMNTKHTEAQGLFVAKRVEQNGEVSWDVMNAGSAKAQKDPKTGETYLILTQGHHYQGRPGQANYQLTDFERYEARLAHSKPITNLGVRSLPFQKLLPWNNPDLRKAAELQWRISVPLMVLVLTLIGVPLSRVNPRAGKFAKLLPGILLAFVYADFLFIMRGWIIDGKIPVWFGLWGLHAVIALIGLSLFWRQNRCGT